MKPKDNNKLQTYIEHSIEQSLAAAHEAGWTVEPIYGDEHTLLLDLDTPESELLYAKNFNVAQRWIGLVEIARWKSKSGVNTHVVVSAPTTALSLRERAALQAFLGSDPTRELCSWFQARDGGVGKVLREDPHVLFKPCGTKT